MDTNELGLVSVETKNRVPLQSVVVEANLNLYIAQLFAKLTYCNDSESPIETVFKCVVEQSYSVVELKANIGGRSITAEIQENESARQRYDDAISSGHTAVLAEEKTEDVLSISMGNLPPHAEAVVYLRLVAELNTEGDSGKARFSLPAVFKPRYTPRGSTDPLITAEGCGDERMECATVPAVNSCTLVIDNATAVADVVSPTHDIHLHGDPARDQITVSVSDTELKQDLVVLIQYKEKHKPRLVLEEGDHSTNDFMSRPAIMFSFLPEFPSDVMTCEFIFLVDQSGSMQGVHIASARETLVLFLKSLPQGSFFNVIGFGSDYAPLFESSRPYNQANVDMAVAYACVMEASLGETELLPPLRYIFGQSAIPGARRQVFVLTDGAVSNTHDCIDLVQKNAHQSRCFTVGIGSGASTALVEGIAKAGNGTAEFVKEGEKTSLQAKVIRSLKCALQPAVTDPSVEFCPSIPNSIEMLHGPTNLPAIFNGHKIVVYGVLTAAPRDDQGLNGEVVFRGILSGQPLCVSVPYNLGAQPKVTSKMIHHLAAKAIIRDWETGKEDRHKIVKLSRESGVLSSHTSFVAVSEGVAFPLQRPLRVWNIEPGPYRAGEHGKGADLAPWSLGGYFRRSMSYLKDSLFFQHPKKVQKVASYTVADDSPISTEWAGLSGTLQAIVGLQRIDGSWPFDDGLPVVLGKGREELLGACPAQCFDSMTEIWATVLILTHLRVKFAVRHEEWELIGLKAERWLQLQSLPQGLTLGDMYIAARRVLQ